MMIDLTNKNSLNSCDKWIAELKKHGGDRLPIFLVGNKSDLKSNRQIKKETANKYAKE